MSEAVIHAEGLSKRYRIGERERYYALRDVLARAFLAPFRRSRGPRDAGDLWALRDVTFDVAQGEVVGLIGRNGAGKTTLLKILSRITRPTAGFAEIRGRVGSLLEVGTGFHPELTGRENVYLSGAILGMKNSEIARKFDEIVSFAGVERFIDTPLKHYSTGMQMRLAFAVAAHLEPEILLVDEVLAVGDLEFQKKCLGKMQDVSKSGRTIVFVSHNITAISTLTNRTLLLDGGGVDFDGDTYQALGRYRELLGGRTVGEYVAPDKATGVILARVITSDSNQVHRFGRPLAFEFHLRFREKPKVGGFGFQILDDEGRPVVYLRLFDSTRPWTREGTVVLRCTIPRPRLYLGRYSLALHLGDRAAVQHLETVQVACPFEVVMDGVPHEFEWVRGTCKYLEDAEWDVV